MVGKIYKHTSSPGSGDFGGGKCANFSYGEQHLETQGDNWSVFVQDLSLGLPVAHSSTVLGDLHSSKDAFSEKGCTMTRAAGDIE